MTQPTRGSIRYGAPAPGRENTPHDPGDLDRVTYDVAILGAGVVGCALAYELSQYDLRVVVLDQNHDVGEGTSKANSAIIHTGFDAKPGTLESELVTRASREWPELAARLKVPFLQTSALLVATSAEQAKKLPDLHANALANGVDDVELLNAEKARRLEPNISPDTRGALRVLRESIVDPFAVPIAFAEIALESGVDFVLGVRVTGVSDRGAAIKRIECTPGDALQARIVVNVAGLGSRVLARSYGGEPFDINPRRGQFVIYDHHARSLLQHILLPIPTERSKGMLVTPTIFGNLLAGPTAEDLDPDQVNATETTVEGIARIKANAIRLCPTLEQQPIIASYAGLRCNCAQGSYWIRFNDGHPGFVTVAGIRSTGLTSSISLARHLIEGMQRECGLTLREDPQAVRTRDDVRWPGWWRRPYERADNMHARPDYGHIICTCEHISRGEIVDALDSPLKPRTLDAIKRRTRALTGRCQAFQCGIPVARIISEHCGVALHHVTKHGPGSEITRGPARERTNRKPASVAVRPASVHFRVAIVGAGPAGIGAAVDLSRRGIGPVVVLERGSRPGGVPARYAAKTGGVPTFVIWTRGRVMFGQQYAELLERELAASQAELWIETQVMAMDRAERALTVVRPGLGTIRVTADAVILACGAREMSIPERGWIVGRRLARVYPTMQLLDLLDGDGSVPMERPVVLGSDLIAYAAAAKLRAQGTAQAVIVDRRKRPATAFPGRLYFRRWARPAWHGNVTGVDIMGNDGVEQIATAGNGDSQILAQCDGVVVSGDLVPNSELAVEAGLDVALPERVPVLQSGVRFTEPGFFAAGNIVGGFHGAQWCFFHGKRAARATARYLASQEPALVPEHT